LQTIARFYEPWKAYVVCGRLWSEDIPAFVAFELAVGNQWLNGLALGGAKLQVPNGFEDAARDVMRQAAAGAYREELEYELGPQSWIRCPHCGADNYREVRPVVITVLAMVLVFYTGLAITPDGRTLRCRVCKTVWRPGPDPDATTPGSL
jgi:hypothetical protein